MIVSSQVFSIISSFLLLVDLIGFQYPQINPSITTPYSLEMQHEEFYFCYDTGIDRVKFCTFPFFFHPQITLIITKLHTLTTIQSNSG